MPSALVLLDLMPRLLTTPLAPRSGDDVLDAAVALAALVRRRGGHVLAVRSERPVEVQPPGSGIAPELSTGHHPELLKRTIGAFHGTGLDDWLHARDVTRLVVAGIMTNMAVESTVRAASDHGWDDIVVVEDATAALSAAEHEASIRHGLPPFARITTLAALPDVEAP